MKLFIVTVTNDQNQVIHQFSILKDEDWDFQAELLNSESVQPVTLYDANHAVRIPATIADTHFITVEKLEE